jgi:hypothetical protein
MTEFRDQNQVVRKLARLLPGPASLKMRAARTNIQTYRVQNGNSPLILPADYFPIDNRSTFNKRFLLDQEQHGSCTGFSNAGAEMKCLYLGNGVILVLSGAFTYALICGGSDNGSVITDAMTASMTIGNVLQSQFGSEDLVFKGRPQVMPAALLKSAKEHLATFCVTVGSWAEAVTAVLMGMIVQVPIQVGNNFEMFDRYGVAGFSNGPGNHSVHCDGVILLPDGRWALTMMNSWGLWGPLKDGRCLLVQKHIDGAATADDAFAHASSLLLPPPVLAI